MTADIITTGPTSIESYAENLNAKLQVAAILAKSGMLPPSYRSPEAVLTAILYGRELGFSPMRSIMLINVIQGRPTLSAQALKAKAIENGGIFNTLEWTDKVCKLEVKRGEWKQTFEYTWEEAQLAGYTTKDNWKRMPKPMLYARAVSVAINNMFADVLGGLYSTEEMQDAVEVSPKKEEQPAPVLAPSVAADAMPEWEAMPREPSPHGLKKVSPDQELKNAIELGDLQVIGDHVITTRCTHSGSTVRDVVTKFRPWTLDNLNRFNKVDRPAIDAFLEATEESEQGSLNI